MNKRGELIAFAVVAFILVTGTIIAGSYVITEKNSGFVGDMSTKMFYDITCERNIQEQSRIHFPSLEDAIKSNFIYSTC